MAQEARIPAGYLSKVMQGLSRAGIVTGQRGIKGGFVLTRPPGKITVLDILASVDPLRRITTCPLGPAGHCKELCLVHLKMDEAIAAVEKIFKGTTLAGLIKKAPRRSC